MAEMIITVTEIVDGTLHSDKLQLVSGVIRHSGEIVRYDFSSTTKCWTIVFKLDGCVKEFELDETFVTKDNRDLTTATAKLIRDMTRK